MVLVQAVDFHARVSKVTVMIAAINFPDISPEIFAFDLFGLNIALRWYAMAYIAGIALGWQILKAAITRPLLWRDGSPMEVAKLEHLLNYIVAGVIGGGRLGYVLFYKPAYYAANPIEIPMIWTGGMSFHGGFLGVIVGVWLFSKRHKVALPAIADGIALAAPVAIGLVRISNFINAELWGRETNVAWGVIFPTEAAQSCATAAGLCARHPSQLYEAGLEGLVLGLILALLAFRFGGLKKPWLLSGVFFAGYGVARFAVEFIRQPDAQFVTAGNPLGLAFQMDGWGLTMGQTLTLPMIIVGAGVVFWAARR
jgi:phosphatidylglycerol:prolipoprotein diacylglycerol transferase